MYFRRNAQRFSRHPVHTHRRRCLTRCLSVTLLSLLLADVSIAKSEQRYDGQTVKTDFSVGYCDVQSMTVKYKIEERHGKPWVSGAYTWKPAYGTAADCLEKNLVVWLKIRSGKSYGYIRIAPKTPRSDQGFSETYTTEMHWNDFICSYNGEKKQNCFNSRRAREVYDSGEIDGFSLSQQ